MNPLSPLLAPKLVPNFGSKKTQILASISVSSGSRFGSKKLPKIKKRWNFRSIFLSISWLILCAPGLHYGTILAPKIDPGGARARKGRPLILNNPPRVFNGFGLGGCPGIAKIDFKTASENQSIFLYIFDPKMTPKWSEKGTILEAKRHEKIIKKMTQIRMEKNTKKEPKRSPK